MDESNKQNSTALDHLVEFTELEAEKNYTVNAGVKTKNKKTSGIAFRMLLLMIIFISLIFSLIFISFNFFIKDYIQRDMTNQLSNAVQEISENRNAIIFDYGVPRMQVSHSDGGYWLMLDPYSVYTSVVRYLRDKNANSEVTTIIYSPIDSQRYFPNSDNDMLLNLNEMDNIINIIESNHLSEQDKIYKTSTSSGNYYFTTVDLGSMYGLTGFSAVFYLSSGKYDNFIKSIYVMLLIILLFAMLFTILYVLFISRSISKPIQKLCSFADEIGHGNFKRNEYSFRDRELIDLNNRMNETAGKLEKNDEDQKTFFQNVSHELKTPLMSIRGYAEGIKYGVFAGDNDMKNATDIIMAESDRLNELVADLLYISKMDASKDINNFENMTNVNLFGFVENCAEKLRGLLISQEKNEKNREKKIDVIRPLKDTYINCNEEDLMRAVMNIIANCVQYAKTTVEISFYENESSVFLYVRDDGPGISEIDLPNIFKRFYKGATGKHGIGLAITKAIIEQHNAKITARNRIDETGAEFIIEFDRKF